MYCLSTQKIQIRDKAALVYTHNEWQGKKKASILQLHNMLQARQQAYSGKLSPNTKKRLARAIVLLVQSSKSMKIYNPVIQKMMCHRLSFITLTIPKSSGIIDCKYAYESLLRPFLQWLQKTKKVNTYVWKAELQKSKQLHYHLTTPAFIHYQEIRDKWNYLMRKNNLLENYYKETGHHDPNSTDIHKVNHVKNLANYMLKEFMKSIQNASSVNGKVWDCSENLKGKKYFTVEFQKIHGLLLDAAVNNNLATKITMEQFTMIKFNEEIQDYLLEPGEMQEFQNYMDKIAGRKSLLSQ